MKLIKRTKEGETLDEAYINWDYKKGHYIRLILWLEKGFDRQIYIRYRWNPKPNKFFLTSTSISETRKVYERAMEEWNEKE